MLDSVIAPTPSLSMEFGAALATSESWWSLGGQQSSDTVHSLANRTFGSSREGRSSPQGLRLGGR
jgi:hypothetical protein